MAPPAACRISPARMCSTLRKGHPGMPRDPADAVRPLANRQRFRRRAAFECFALRRFPYAATRSTSSTKKELCV